MKIKKKREREREIRLQYFSEQILSVKLLMVAIGGKKIISMVGSN